MPKMADSTSMNLDNYSPIAVPATETIVQQGTPDLDRSPLMLAGLPGLGSGPDAVIRQFNGGNNNLPRMRTFVP